MGDETNAGHFREPPPGKRHAVCKPRAQYCAVHQDQYNPHDGIVGLVGHFFEWKGAPIVIAGLVLVAVLSRASAKDQPKYYCPICMNALPYNMLPGFSYQCQRCKNWLHLTQ